MGVIVNKENNKDTELSRRIDVELREKLSGNSKSEKNDAVPDFAEDAEYMKDLKRTGKFGWVWILLVAFLLLLLVVFGLSFSNK